MHLFYQEQIDLLAAFNEGQRHLALTGEEATHLKVLRMKEGDEFLLTDGLGNLSNAVIEQITNKTNLVRLTKIKSFVKHPAKIHIAIAPPKNIARFEWFLEKATEIGIDEITPLYCDHSERVILRTDRLNKILVSAMKQSLKTFLPKLNEPIKFKDFITSNHPDNNTFIAWLDRHNEQPHLKAVYRLNKPTTILIGPEGDFSEKEVILAKENGCLNVSLGQSRLRTETAAMVACLIVNVLNEPDSSGYPMTLE